MEGNEQGPNRESTKEQATQRRNNTGQADVFQTPVFNNHQRILDTVTALKGQIGGCVWAGRRLHLHSMREYIEPRGYFVECCWSSPPCGPPANVVPQKKRKRGEVIEVINDFTDLYHSSW